MSTKNLYPTVPLLLAGILLLCGRAALAQSEFERAGTIPPPATAERLFAADFECNETGYRQGEIPDDELVNTPNRIPNGW